MASTDTGDGARPNMSRRQFLRLVVAGTGISASSILAACGTSTSSTPAAPAPTAVPAPTAAPSGPRRGGSSVWAMESDPVALNPITNSNFSSTQGFEHSYESLTAYNDKLEIIPALAESWETPDDLTYIFNLRKGVKWHDGSDFTAEDVKYTFDLVLQKDGPAVWRNNFDQIETVEIVDPHTVKFTTKSPFPGMLGACAILRSSAIIPKGAFEKGNLDNTVVGTGPYKLVEYVPKDYVKLVRNPDYWGDPFPYLDEVTFKIMEEEETRIAALRAGTVDYAFLSAEGAERVKSEPNLVLQQGPRTYLYVMIFNMLREPWSNPKVRLALSYATNRLEIIDKALSGAGTVSGPIATGFGNWFVAPDQLLSGYYKSDIERAKALLKEAGVAEGQKLDLLVTNFSGEVFSRTAVVFQEQMKQIGIDVQIRQVEQGVFIKEASPDGNWNYDMNINAYSPRHDPDGYLWARFFSENPYAVGYKNPKMDELLKTARATIDPAQRKVMYDEIQGILLEEAPMLWIAVDNASEVTQSYLKGYVRTAFTRRDWGLKNAWLDK